MIKSFADKQTERLWCRQYHKRLSPELNRMARRKLIMLERAKTLDDLRIPPGNRLEALKGNRQGQHAIRINDQWRICFEWLDGDAWNVEIVDYH